MKVIKTECTIKCDAAGCHNLAEFTVKNMYGIEDVNLCGDCAKKISAELIKLFKGAENVRKTKI